MVFPLPQRGNLTEEYELELYFRYIHIGADGSIIHEYEAVYVIFAETLEHRVDEIDHFDCGPALMRSGRHWHASKMIPIDRPGYIVKRIIALQRIWRNRRLQRAEKRTLSSPNRELRSTRCMRTRIQ